MSVNRLFKRVVSTQRMVSSGSGHKREFATNLASVECALQPAGREAGDFSSGAFYNSYNMFCASETDILVGDRVIDENSKVYTVKGVAIRNYGNNANNHLGVTLVQGL